MSAAASLEQIDLRSSSGRLTAGFVPAMGGEMTSLTVLHAGQRHELLYRGGDLSPAEGWSGRAPHLWPVIGRTYPLGQEPVPGEHKTASLGWFVDGVLHPMPQHGFGRTLPWRQVSRSRDSILMVLRDSEASRPFFPFGFALWLDAVITDAAVRLVYRVEAADQNATDMPFTLGNHATFRTPLIAGSALGDCRVRSEAALRLPIDGIGCPVGPAQRDVSFQAGVALDRLPAGEVIALDGFEPGHASVTINDPAGLEVRVSHTRSAPVGPAPSLVTLWGHPSDGYLCLEPWLGLPNALSSGTGAVHLQPGCTMTWTVEISPTQIPQIVGH